MARAGRPDDELDERALAARVAMGDVAAFSLLYDRYARPVYALAAHLAGATEADELVQGIFLRLWHKAGQYDPTRAPFAAWFMAVARHHLRDALRRRSLDQRLRAATEIEALLAVLADPAAGPEEALLRRQERASVRTALAALPPEQRHVLVLAYFGDLSHTTIAQQLGLPLGTVKKRIRLGMHKLRAALAGERPADAPARQRGSE